MFKPILCSSLLLAASAATTDAQLCFGPDQLDAGNCCQPVDVNLPQFPPISMPGKGICWDSCTPIAQSCLQINIGQPPFGPNCGEFVTPVEVLGCNGQNLLKGEAVFDYTRTWAEGMQPGAGPSYQVYRFAVKIDFEGDFAATPVCPVPPSLGPYPTAFYYGYVDYALDCAANSWESSIVLYHSCDAFVHNPLLSSQPGSFNPTETYAIVGPDTPGNPFMVNPIAPINGAFFQEAMRSTDSPIPFACLAEERTSGNIQHIATVCMCPPSLNGTQTHLSRLAGQGNCGGSYSSINLWPTAPWYEMVTTGIGNWTTANSYPGPERAGVTEGLMFYNDTCSATGVVNSSVDIFYGGVTQGGFFAFPTSPIGGGQTFIDMASNYSNPFPGPIALPMLGNVNATDHLIYLTLP